MSVDRGGPLRSFRRNCRPGGSYPFDSVRSSQRTSKTSCVVTSLLFSSLREWSMLAPTTHDAFFKPREITIRKTKPRDRPPEGVGTHALKIEARLHNRVGQRRANAFSIDAQCGGRHRAVMRLACTSNLYRAIHSTLEMNAGHSARAIKATIAE